MKRHERDQQKLAKLLLLVSLCGLTACSQHCHCTCPCSQPPEAVPVRSSSWFSRFIQRSPAPPKPPPERRLVVSVEEQMLGTFENNTPKKHFPVSTSRFGLGDKLHSNLTPQGRLEIVDIIGEGLPKGSMLCGRVPTGQIVRANTPGHDAIVTRILRLRGKEKQNARTLQRCIYIHGTSAEKGLKKPVSWGCVRMGSKDIIRLCRWVTPGTRVDIIPGRLPAKNMLPP